MADGEEYTQWETRDHGMSHVPGGTELDGARFQPAAQRGAPLKTGIVYF